MQQRVKLCVKRDLTEHDIVSRIMRKENYLIGAQQYTHVPHTNSGRKPACQRALCPIDACCAMSNESLAQSQLAESGQGPPIGIAMISEHDGPDLMLVGSDNSWILMEPGLQPSYGPRRL